MMVNVGLLSLIKRRLGLPYPGIVIWPLSVVGSMSMTILTHMNDTQSERLSHSYADE